MDALAAEIPLVLDELEAELILTQHIRRVLDFRGRGSEQIVARCVGSSITRQRHVPPCDSKDDAV